MWLCDLHTGYEGFTETISVIGFRNIFSSHSSPRLKPPPHLNIKIKTYNFSLWNACFATECQKTNITLSRRCYRYCQLNTISSRTSSCENDLTQNWRRLKRNRRANAKRCELWGGRPFESGAEAALPRVSRSAESDRVRVLSKRKIVLNHFLRMPIWRFPDDINMITNYSLNNV